GRTGRADDPAGHPSTRRRLAAGVRQPAPAPGDQRRDRTRGEPARLLPRAGRDEHLPPRGRPPGPGRLATGRTELVTRRTIDQVLAAARARLDRLTPAEAEREVEQEGAVLVDIRPEAQRAEEGSWPGALIIERNVLEWRFDPACDARLAIA